MPKIPRRELRPRPGYRSREAASFVAQLDDLSRRMRIETRGLTRAELEWQPEPGMNSIGMLLAHNAIVEAFWIQAAVERPRVADLRPILGIGMDDDGMPLKRRGAHPDSLRGKPLAFYDHLLRTARAYTHARCRGLTDRSLASRFRRKRYDGKIHDLEVRWVLYHVVEHFAGHYYQINALRHQYRARPKTRRLRPHS